MIRQEPIDTFLAHAPISDDFRTFVTFGNDAGPVANEVPGVVVLSNGQDSAGAFRVTEPRTWRMYIEFLPTTEPDERVAAARAMVAWMFSRSDAYILWGTGLPGKPGQEEYQRQIGAHCLVKNDEIEVYEITRGAH